MIIGTGVDICSHAEIQTSINEFGAVLFAEQYCTKVEIDNLQKHRNDTKYLSSILTIKEAIGKAFGTGLVEDFWFDDIEVLYPLSWKPKIYLSEASMPFLTKQILTQSFKLIISIDTGREFTVSHCIIQAKS